MASLDQIINVQILQQTGGVPRASFGVPLLMGNSQRSTNRANVYTDLDGVAEDYATTDFEYLWAQAYFSQSPRPDTLVIGSRAGKAVITVDSVQDTTDYVVNLNGTDYTYTSDGDALEAEILAGLQTLLDGVSGFTATVVTTTVELVSDTGAAFDVTLSTAQEALLSIAFEATGTQTTDLAAIREANDSWYVLATQTRATADIVALAAVIEALSSPKAYGYQTSDAETLTNGATSVANQLKDLGYKRTFGIYNASDTALGDAAWIGETFTQDPGSVTFKFKQLTGVTVSSLTATQQANMDAQNLNYYVEVGGVGITQEGVTASGEFIDVIRDLDYIEINLQADIFDALLQNPKIPLTNQGIAVIESLVRGRLQNGVNLGIFQEGFDVTVPAVADIQTSDKLIRKLPNVKFFATLAGAIHFVEVNGTVSV